MTGVAPPRSRGNDPFACCGFVGVRRSADRRRILSAGVGREPTRLTPPEVGLGVEPAQDELAAGDTFIYPVLRPARATLSIVRISGGWHVREGQCAHNQSVPNGARRAAEI